MIAPSTIAEGFSTWMDSVAAVAGTWRGRLASPRVVALIEIEKGEFAFSADQISGPLEERTKIAADGTVQHVPAEIATLLPGSHVELILRPERFLFQPLDLPGRASEFLGGVVRAQIDRLTPWDANEAAFGWSNPIETGSGRIALTVVAAPLASMTPYVQALIGLGAHSVSVFTNLPGADARATPIKIFEQEAPGEIGGIRRVLLYTLVAAGIAAVAAAASAAFIEAHLDAQADELTLKIASIRGNIGASSAIATGSIAAAQQYKHDAASTVLIFETLSRILPDHTYVTELQVEGNKLKLVGMTRDAPSLVGLLEKSGFTRASFFAPTTRSPSQPGEQFNIEAVIQLPAVPRS